jgi:hypothetical protein
MKSVAVVSPWESFPESLAAPQSARCLGRILASLPRRLNRLVVLSLAEAAILIAHGIAGAHADVRPGNPQCHREREELRETGLCAIAASRKLLQVLEKDRIVSRSNVAAALELLERVQYGLASRPLP